MSWYFAENQQQMGPFDDEQFKQMVAEGRISSETLVWRDGMGDWAPYRDIAASLTSEGFPQGRVICSQCGGVFEPDDVVELEGMPVCARCKPVFVQRLREGAVTGLQVTFGGFWIRAGAKLLDGLLLFILNMCLGMVAGFVGGLLGESAFAAATLFVQILSVFIPAAYYTYFVGAHGATLGKMVCGLKVITADGGRVSYLRALGRYFAEILSSLVLCIGYIMVAFDDEKRALHDIICNTRVIKTT